MKVKVKTHTVLDTTILVSGYIGIKTNAFNDLAIEIEGLIEFIRKDIPNYFIKFCASESMDEEDELFDKERMLDEIDYGILSEYIIESNVLNA